MSIYKVTSGGCNAIMTDETETMQDNKKTPEEEQQQDNIQTPEESSNKLIFKMNTSQQMNKSSNALRQSLQPKIKKQTTPKK